MSRDENGLSFFIVLLIAMSCLTTCELASAQDRLSLAAVVADAQGKTLYIAETTAKQVAVVDTDKAKVTDSIAIGAKPTGLALSGDGKLLYVTCADPEGTVCVIETDTAKIVKRLPSGYGAQSPVLSPDDKTLYVCNRFDNNVSVISTDISRTET